MSKGISRWEQSQKQLQPKPFLPEEAKVWAKAKELGLVEDEWLRDDGSFRVAAIQQRVREEEELLYKRKELWQSRWLGAVANQAQILGSMLGFFGIILSLLLIQGDSLKVVDESVFAEDRKWLTLILAVLDYFFIAMAALTLHDVVKSEREIAWKDSAATTEEKERVNQFHSRFKLLLVFILVLTGLLVIVRIL